PQARQWLEFYMAARMHENMCYVYESNLHCHSASTNTCDPEELRNMALQIHNAAETIFLWFFGATLDPNGIRTGKMDCRPNCMTLESLQCFLTREPSEQPVLDPSPDYMMWPLAIPADIEQRLLYHGATLDSTLFSKALRNAYNVLKLCYYPVFIADALSRNVTRGHCVWRGVVALVFLWVGFALPLACIFLNSEPRTKRLWSALPLFLGWWNIAVGFSGCDLLLSMMKRYQSPNMTESGVKQEWSVRSQLVDWHRYLLSTRVSVDLTATRLVHTRSIRWFAASLIMTALCTAILFVVPGTTIYID
ncbi:Bud site selection protein, Revert to axial protein 1, partial [Coemansia sp. S17]